MNKHDFRKMVCQRIAALSLEARAKQSAAICQAVAASSEWKMARTVGLFSPLPSEPNIDLLWAVLGERTVCYPRIHGEDLIFIRVPERAALLETGRWNLMEPEHKEDAVVPPEDLDLLLVPGLAFTADRHRLGRGKGYYDRLLASAALKAHTIGVCFREQLVPMLPTEPHDQPVKRVICDLGESERHSPHR
jgi:5-formyltetrahydrofolate cyclo-ligase